MSQKLTLLKRFNINAFRVVCHFFVIVLYMIYKEHQVFTIYHFCKIESNVITSVLSVVSQRDYSISPIWVGMSEICNVIIRKIYSKPRRTWCFWHFNHFACHDRYNKTLRFEIILHHSTPSTFWGFGVLTPSIYMIDITTQFCTICSLSNIAKVENSNIAKYAVSWF